MQITNHPRRRQGHGCLLVVDWWHKDVDCYFSENWNTVWQTIMAVLQYLPHSLLMVLQSCWQDIWYIKIHHISNARPSYNSWFNEHEPAVSCFLVRMRWSIYLFLTKYKAWGFNCFYNSSHDLSLEEDLFRCQTWQCVSDMRTSLLLLNANGHQGQAYDEVTRCNDIN